MGVYSNFNFSPILVDLLKRPALVQRINPIIYILIEIAERELDSKLLIALYLVKKGFHVIVGYQWALAENRDCLPAGIFFFKGMNKIHTDSMARVCQSGHTVLLWKKNYSIVVWIRLSITISFLSVAYTRLCKSTNWLGLIRKYVYLTVDKIVLN